MSDTTLPQGSTLGWLGFMVGAVALILTLVTLWAGPFAPQQTTGVTLGELAAEVAKSAARSAAGLEQPAPVAVPRTIDDYIAIGLGGLGGLAIVIGVASFIRHERKRAAMSGIALGGLAIGIQVFAWSIMLIAGAIVLAGLMSGMRGAFGDIFGGLFDG